MGEPQAPRTRGKRRGKLPTTVSVAPLAWRCKAPTDDVTLTSDLAGETFDGPSHLVDLTGRGQDRFPSSTAVY